MTDMPLLPPLPSPSDAVAQQPFWSAAADGKLVFQRCRQCSHAFLPGREECPRCLTDDVAWEEASGRARLVSWVVYHRAFHPAFADRLPYTVAVVALEEGPQMISNIVGMGDPEALRIDQPLRLRIDRDGDISVPRFEPA